MVDGMELGTNSGEIWSKSGFLMPAVVDQLQQLVMCNVNSNLTPQVRSKWNFFHMTHTHYDFCTTRAVNGITAAVSS